MILSFQFWNPFEYIINYIELITSTFKIKKYKKLIKCSSKKNLLSFIIKLIMNFDHYSLQICKKEETNDELKIKLKF